MNKSISMGACLGAFSPLIIFLAVRELVKLLAHNAAMYYFDNAERATEFLLGNSIYVTGICNVICIVIFAVMYRKCGLSRGDGSWEGGDGSCVPLLGRRNRPHLPTILKAVFACLCLSMAVTAIIHLLGIDAASAGYQRVQAGYSGKHIAVLVIALGILAPLSEELCFRGLMYTRIRDILGQAPALVFSSVCFGLIHGNAAQMIHAGALGILLAFLYEKGGSIIVPLIGHMAVNLFAIFTDASGGMENMYRNTFVAAGFIIVNITVVYMMLNSMRDKK